MTSDDSRAPRPRREHRFSMALLALVVVFSASAIGSLATFANIPTWYAHLAKPGFTPPNWLFGPVWTPLYLLMALAFWRVLALAAPLKGKPIAIGVFIVQIMLNALWSIAFFGLHSPLLGLMVIGVLLIAIIATIAAFYPLDRAAAFLMTPYLAWVAFASALNLGVFLLNR